MCCLLSSFTKPLFVDIGEFVRLSPWVCITGCHVCWWIISKTKWEFWSLWLRSCLEFALAFCITIFGLQHHWNSELDLLKILLSIFHLVTVTNRTARIELGYTEEEEMVVMNLIESFCVSVHIEHWNKSAKELEAHHFIHAVIHLSRAANWAASLESCLSFQIHSPLQVFWWRVMALHIW